MGDFVLNMLRRHGPMSQPVMFARQALGLHAMLTSVGYDHCRDRMYDWHGLQRGSAQFALLQYTISGRGQLTFEGRRYTVEPGRTMLLHFPHDNRYWLEPGGAWEFFYLCLNGSEVMRVWRSVVGRLGPVAALSEPVVAAAASACRAVLEGEAATPGAASSLAYDLTMRLLDEAAPVGAAARERAPAIQRAIDLCRARLSEEVDVADLAAAAGLSRHHFTRRFHQSEGMPPGEFIGREKMKEAVRLLQSTDDPVKAVALRTGFASANYFGKAFRRMYGVSPGEFRRSGMYSTR